MEDADSALNAGESNCRKKSNEAIAEARKDFAEVVSDGAEPSVSRDVEKFEFMERNESRRNSLVV